MSALTGEVLWITIALLGVGTFAIRFSFLAFAGERPLPAWALRALRYVPTSVLPAASSSVSRAAESPMVLWPDATGGAADLLRALAALTALVVGAVVRNVLAAIGAGLAVLYGLLALGF